MPLVNTNRLQTFNVLAQTGNGFAYFYLRDEHDLLTQTGDVRYRLEAGLSTFKRIYGYSDIYVNEGGIFDFRNKALKFKGLSGTAKNPNGAGNGYYIPVST